MKNQQLSSHPCMDGKGQLDSACNIYWQNPDHQLKNAVQRNVYDMPVQSFSSKFCQNKMYGVFHTQQYLQICFG